MRNINTRINPRRVNRAALTPALLLAPPKGVACAPATCSHQASSLRLSPHLQAHTGRLSAHIHANDATEVMQGCPLSEGHMK